MEQDLNEVFTVHYVKPKRERKIEINLLDDDGEDDFL